jgi:hypothetical protein
VRECGRNGCGIGVWTEREATRKWMRNGLGEERLYLSLNHLSLSLKPKP